MKLNALFSLVIIYFLFFSNSFAQELLGPDGYPLPNGIYIINKEGKILSKGYTGIKDFSEGLAVVWDAPGMGVIDKTGKEIVRLGKYKSIEPFKNGRAVVEKQNGKSNFIDHNGVELLKSEYDFIGKLSEGLYPARKKDKAGYIDSMGNVIIPFKFEYSFPFSDGLAHVRLNRTMQYIDKTGKIVIATSYADAYPFDNGLAEISIGNYVHGIINKKGELIVPADKYLKYIYKGIAYYNNGTAKYLDAHGKEVPEPKEFYSPNDLTTKMENEKKDFSKHGMFPVHVNYGKNTYYGYADGTGTVKIPPVFFQVYPFNKEGVAVVWFVDQDASDALTEKLRAEKNRIDPLLFPGACNTCRGRGAVATEANCNSCSGKGYTHKWTYNAFDKTVKTVSHGDGSQTVYYIPGGTSSYSNGGCSGCGGSGKKMMQCYDCNGTGKPK